MPDRAVVSVSGDGGFMFGVQELATAAKHNIPVVCLVFTDDAYGNVRRIQQDNYEGRVVASDLANPDFVKLGASFGLRAERAKTPKALRKAMSEALKANEPSLIEIPVGVFPDPWRYFMRPRVRGCADSRREERRSVECCANQIRCMSPLPILQWGEG